MRITANRDLTRAAGALTDAMTALEEARTFQAHLIRDADYEAAALARPVLRLLGDRVYDARERVITVGGTITITATTMTITDDEGHYATRIMRASLPEATSYYGLASVGDPLPPPLETLTEA